MIFNNGFARVKLNGRWGLIDINGKEVVRPVFNEIGKFSEGVCCVSINGLWGLVDDKGNQLVPPKYNITWRLL